LTTQITEVVEGSAVYFCGILLYSGLQCYIIVFFRLGNWTQYCWVKILCCVWFEESNSLTINNF